MQIKFEKLLNGRDLGGIATMDGRKIKSGLLLRTAELARASDADIKVLCKKYEIRHIIDFRDKSECARNPDREIPGAEYHNFPALPALPVKNPQVPEAFPQDIVKMFKRIYRELAESGASEYAYKEFFKVLLKGDGAVLWHCTQGKDRTGVAAILLLTALNVSAENIMSDYFLSNDGLRPEFESVREGVPAGDHQRLAGIYFVSQECVDVYFNTVKESFGGVYGALTEQLGLTQADISRLRDLYTE